VRRLAGAHCLVFLELLNERMEDPLANGRPSLDRGRAASGWGGDLSYEPDFRFLGPDMDLGWQQLDLASCRASS
jgi:hypothetical protein